MEFKKDDPGGVPKSSFNCPIGIFITCPLNGVQIMKQGFLIVPFGRKSDVSVIRACAVTCGASQTTREMIRQAKRLGAYVVVIGCLENKGLPEINFIAKNNEEAAENVLSLRTQQGGHMKSLDSASGFTRDDKRTRVLIKIQTGCAFSCAYCVIPSYRGKPQSVPAEKIIKKIKEAETEGYKEIVLTGINICLYKDNRLNLAGLIQKILKETGPLIAPSANPEGLPPATTIAEAKKYFGDKVNFYLAGRTKTKPSTLVKIDKNGRIEVIRK